MSSKNGLTPCCDLKILKTHVVEVGVSLFDKKYLKGKKSRYFNCLPKKWERDMKRLAIYYGVKFKAVKKTSLDGSGEYWRDTISIITDKWRKKKCGKVWKIDSLITLYFHELAHGIQNNIEMSIGGKNVRKRYREMLIHERTAERLAYFLAKTHAQELKYHHGKFRGYLCKEDQDSIRYGLKNNLF